MEGGLGGRASAQPVLHLVKARDAPARLHRPIDDHSRCQQHLPARELQPVADVSDLGLEFQLAADIVRTAIEPSWQQIGQLAAIATIRTGLNYFLVGDLRRNAQPDAVARSTPTQYKTDLPRAADRV